MATKYRHKKCEFNGFKFDSQAEFYRKRFLNLNPDLIFKEVRLVGNNWSIKEL